MQLVLNWPWSYNSCNVQSNAYSALEVLRQCVIYLLWKIVHYITIQFVDGKRFRLLQNDKKCRGFSPKMSRFNQLLNSKYFLLVFVNTLDQQLRDFSLHDRFVYTTREVSFLSVQYQSHVVLNSTNASDCSGIVWIIIIIIIIILHLQCETN